VVCADGATWRSAQPQSTEHPTRKATIHGQPATQGSAKLRSSAENSEGRGEDTERDGSLAADDTRPTLSVASIGGVVSPPMMPAASPALPRATAAANGVFPASCAGHRAAPTIEARSCRPARTRAHPCARVPVWFECAAHGLDGLHHHGTLSGVFASNRRDYARTRAPRWPSTIRRA